MKWTVTVKPGSKIEKVEETSPGQLKVWVKAQAKEGQANEALIALLAERFSLPKARVHILHGLASRNKSVEIKI